MIFIHDDHECKIGAITSQDLLQHLRSEGDATHTAISIYLEKLNTFSQGNVRQDPSVNSKKKPHSEEEEKEEENEEEEEVATELDCNDVSHEHVDMNACDHSKLSWKCRQHVGDMSPQHKMSFQFWPDGPMLPTQNTECPHLIVSACADIKISHPFLRLLTTARCCCHSHHPQPPPAATHSMAAVAFNGI
jgi:hypothetical protein